MAEGWIWIPYFIIMVGLLKKEAKMVLYHFVFSTLLTQIPKLVIWNQVTRPIASGIDKNLIHLVNGMEIHRFNSFPSGHTATAFTLFLLTVQLFENKTAFILGIIYAIFCGYSRVYLGQHFPLDIAGGIIVAILTKEISYRIYKRSNHV
jgi:membrane-associated phospholipid phosphatase